LAWSWAAMGAGALAGGMAGLAYEITYQLQQSTAGGCDFDWGAVGRTAAVGAFGGAWVGAVTGVFTGDPTAASVLLAVSTGIGGGIVMGSVDAACDYAEDQCG